MEKLPLLLHMLLAGRRMLPPMANTSDELSSLLKPTAQILDEVSKEPGSNLAKRPKVWIWVNKHCKDRKITTSKRGQKLQKASVQKTHWRNRTIVQKILMI